MESNIKNLRQEYDKKYYQTHKTQIRERQKIYEKKHKKERSVRQKKYYQNNDEYKTKASQYYNEYKSRIRDKQKKYYEDNKTKILKKHKKYRSNKIKTDINYKLAANLRTRLYVSIRKDYKSGSAVKDLGCSIPELKTYLESKFQEGMSWDNWGRAGWHIDHIIPLDFFDLQNREEFLKACNYTNLQPLWAKENIKKSSNI